jgi:hypothetical protein
VTTPWRPIYQAVYVAYLGIVIESAIIDIDHTGGTISWSWACSGA